ncbi:MAG: hypothetical protein HY865_00915 [Chloroflexi bacterium]|nr:hypothetical protein [Chloroflexota bacterium]
MSQKAKTLARTLLRKNRGTRKYPARSWRVIAREDYDNKVNHAVLFRIAHSEGEWYPKDEQLQILLGLKKQRAARTTHAHEETRPIYDRPTHVLLWQFVHREAMP